MSIYSVTLVSRKDVLSQIKTLKMKSIRNDVNSFTILLDLKQEDQKIYWQVRSEIENQLLKNFSKEELVVTYVWSHTKQPSSFRRIGLSIHPKNRIAINLQCLHKNLLLENINDIVQGNSIEYVGFISKGCNGFNQSFRWYASYGSVHENDWLNINI